jgi:hypothetical protein
MHDGRRIWALRGGRMLIRRLDPGVLCRALRGCSSRCFGMDLDDVALVGIPGQRADLGCQITMEDPVVGEGPLRVIPSPRSPALDYPILPPLPLLNGQLKHSAHDPDLRGPGIGVRPSFKALAISAAFHLAYCCFCSNSSLIPFGASKQRSTSMNCAATTNLRIVALSKPSISA